MKNRLPTTAAVHNVIKSVIILYSGWSWHEARISSKDHLYLIKKTCPLFHFYRHGENVPKDYNKAHDYLQKAADSELAEAMYELALMHYHGEGTAVDKVKAKHLLNSAASNGFDKADIEIRRLGLKAL